MYSIAILWYVLYVTKTRLTQGIFQYNNVLHSDREAM